MKSKKLLILFVIALCSIIAYGKQRQRYRSLKQQRTALRKEVDDLKVMRDLANQRADQVANAHRSLQASYRQDKKRWSGADNELNKSIARSEEIIAQQKKQLAATRIRLNNFVFRDLTSTDSKNRTGSHWQLIERSTTPSPDTSPYPDCLITVKLKQHALPTWKDAAEQGPENIISGITWGFQDRVIGPLANLATNDLFYCELIPESEMDPSIKKLQLIDQVTDLESDTFYLTHVEAIHISGIKEVVVGKGMPATPLTREQHIAHDLARINQRIEHHHGWVNWFAETRTYRNILQSMMDEINGPLNHENRIYMPTIAPLDMQPTATFPTHAVATIIKLRDQLAERNIDLIVAPVPTKEVVNGLHFLDQPPEDRVLSPYRLMMQKSLLEADVEVVDLLDPLIDALPAHDHVFYDALDAHPADGAIQTIAAEVSKRLARYDFFPDEEKLWEMEARYRVAAKYFEQRSAVGTPYRATRVFHHNAQPVGEYSDDRSPILLLSDSFCGVPRHYNVSSANIPAHIYKSIGVLPQKFQQNMGGPKVLDVLASVPESAWPTKRVCLFIFGEFYDAFPEEIPSAWPSNHP